MHLICRGRSPGKETEIVTLSDDLLLKSGERLGTLSVQHWHVDVKYPQKTVSHVFDARSLPGCGPRHPLGNWKAVEELSISKQFGVDLSDPRDYDAQIQFRSAESPLPVVKLQFLRCDELLQSPASCEPPAVLEARAWVFWRETVTGPQICKPRITNHGVLVPLKHGVEGLREFGATSLTDATGIDPNV